MNKVIKLDIPAHPEAGAPLPLLVQDEGRALLTFATTADDHKRVRAVVRLDGVLTTRFGHPNDEALGSHPLYAMGLTHYACFEVLESSWLSEMNESNQKVFPNFTYKARHFVVTFKDSTFECLASDLKAEQSDSPVEEIVHDFVRESETGSP